MHPMPLVSFFSFSFIFLLYQLLFTATYDDNQRWFKQLRPTYKPNGERIRRGGDNNDEDVNVSKMRPPSLKTQRRQQGLDTSQAPGAGTSVFGKWAQKLELHGP